MVLAGENFSVDGHRIKVTNLDKVLYPEVGMTKRDVLAYLMQVADPLVAQAAHRPVTRKRWVNGVGTQDKPGDVFFQKDLDGSQPPWIKCRTIEHSDHHNTYPLLNDRATLAWLGQIGSLEIHVPQWRFGPRGAVRNPDRLVLDLDPGPGAGLIECAEVARLARAILDDLGLHPMPVTSGSKGIHLYAALDVSRTSAQISEVAHELARSLEADHRDLVVSSMKKSLRAGKVLVDWSQNNANKTTITPYSLRGRPHPMVAAPRTWAELDDPSLQHLDYLEVLDALAERGDPLAELSPPKDSDGESDRGDRLASYRRKRDPQRTPEPVPAERPRSTAGRSFVIQEHHARRLHWDFRLEHDGVLVSWAVPKGVPTDPSQNRLAVQTEDHPLEYGSFEGDIPQGEYGGGHVSLWDTGDFQLEKWRDGKEIIAILHGRDDGGLGGAAKFALIHTGSGHNSKNWLMHRMELDPDTSPTPTDNTSPTPVDGTSPTPADGTSLTPVELVETSTSHFDRRRLGQPDRDYAPMLATLGDHLPGNEDDWAFEMKWDGIRALAEVTSEATRLRSRNGIDLSMSYPELTHIQPLLNAEQAVLDGEIVALRAGRPDFGLLQTRMNLTRKADVDKVMRQTPVHLMLFDLLEVNHQSLVDSDYSDRRDLLEQLISDDADGRVLVPPAFEGSLRSAMDSSLELNLEGVVAKRRNSHYLPGRRADSWLKIKHHRSQEVVIGGWKPGAGRRAGGIGSLLMGIPDQDGALRYVGKVGTGFSDDALDQIAGVLKRLERKTSPFADIPRADARDAHWTTPSQVGEVEFAEWTGPGRLRQPSWRGWRPDKAPQDVRQE